MATDYADLIPVAMAREVVETVTERDSELMRLARVIPMLTGSRARARP
jgi:hypothetical protein